MVRYSAQILRKIERGYHDGCKLWDHIELGVYQTDDNENMTLVGTYKRNYSTLNNTFFHFKSEGHDLALYSPNYTCTRLLSLPDCIDIGGEDPFPGGFCPVEYYVPTINHEFAPFGFVAGCVWGDDTSWKIQYLDLSKAHEGVLIRDSRLGYLEMMDGLSLQQSISFDSYWPEEDDYSIKICTFRYFDLKEKKWRPSDF